MASFPVYRAELRDDSVETWSEKETIAWGPCTPLPTLEAFSKNISASTRSSIRIEVVGSNTEEDKRISLDDTKFVKSCVS